MGVLAAAPVLAHALDWRRRTEAKQKMTDERVNRLQNQLAQAKGLVPTGDDVYKAASFMRKLGAAPGRRPEEKLNMLQAAMKDAKQEAVKKGGMGFRGD